MTRIAVSIKACGRGIAEMDKETLLGTLSPAYGMLKGTGLFGSTTPIGLMNKRDREEEEERQRMAAAGQPAPTGMKKGGKVKSASSRGDGIAKRGKTRGRMV